MTKEIDEKNSTNIMIKVRPELKKLAKEKAKKSDLTLSQVLRSFLNNYVNEKQETLNF